MAAQSTIWVNGKRDSSLALPDRGLNYGDGLFETLLLNAGHIFYLEHHLERLQRGMQVLGLSHNLDDLTLQLRDAARAVQHIPWGALRLTLTRGAGPRGYRPPEQGTCQAIIESSELQRDGDSPANPVALGIAELRLGNQPVLAGLKHLNRLEQVLAAAQVASAGYEEGIVLDGDDNIVSVVSGNIFALQGNHIETPALLRCGVAGTRRAILISRWARAIGLEVIEKTMNLRDLERADEVFYTNALVGVRSVAAIADKKYPRCTVAQRLFEAYRADRS
ncbi:MAG: aminodeoxychorismate lyase [Gammaproteobacteria bacterium]|nr:aminodeoxychorismate lyase [Gammaproteobacteria bacterium]